jgi:hypothetical protein
MRRRLAMLLSATLVAGAAAVLVPASPAAAGIHVCAGLGQAILATGLTYPVTVSTDLPPHPVHLLVIQQSRKTGFTFILNPGACGNTNAPNVKTSPVPTPITASGTEAGWCGFSTGYGTLVLGSAAMRFGWIGIGGALIITGEVVGAVQTIPDTLAGHSCNNNRGASQFIIAGGAIGFDHCGTTIEHLVTGGGGDGLWTLFTVVPGLLTTALIVGPLSTPLVALSIHSTLSLHIWTLLCIPMPVL